jgi:glycosyltransferase involved in cell wall biosynthesis
MKVAIAQNVSLEGHLALSTYMRNIAFHLARREDIDLRLMIQGPASEMGGMAPERVNTIDTDTYTLGGNVKYAWRLYQLLKEQNERERIEVIHCLYPNSSLQAAALFKRTCSPGVKIVYDVRSPWIEVSVERLSLGAGEHLYRKAAYLSETILCRYVDGFIFITGGLREFYARTLKRDMRPSRLIPSGVDLDLFRPGDPVPVRRRYGIPPGDKVLGYVGVLSRDRELDFAIRALSLMRGRGEGYRIIFVGDGDDRERLEGAAVSMGVAERITFTGRIDYREVPDFISTFDLGLCHLPDTLFFRRSFPMKVLEYAACGIRVAASRIGAHEDIAKELPMLLYAYDDPCDLARVLSDAGRAPARVPEEIARYSWENIAGDLVDSYSEVLSRGSCG